MTDQYKYICFSAKQLVQLEKHKALYNSINSYSQDIASSSPGLSPLVVLKTAIQLHHQDSRAIGGQEQGVRSKALPLVQAPLPYTSTV